MVGARGFDLLETTNVPPNQELEAMACCMQNADILNRAKSILLGVMLEADDPMTVGIIATEVAKLGTAFECTGRLKSFQSVIMTEISEFLIDQLSDGPKLRKDIVEAAEKAGFNERTLRHVKSQMRLPSQTDKGGMYWAMQLTKGEDNDK